MPCIRVGGFQPPGQKQTAARLTVFTKQQQEAVCLRQQAYSASVGSRDEPPMTACDGNFIGGEISRKGAISP
jgi:hypothetical protein